MAVIIEKMKIIASTEIKNSKNYINRKISLKNNKEKENL